MFSVYALEVHRSPDGSTWVRDYNSIVQISADETSFRRAVGLADSSGLGDPGINDSFDSIGLDPSVVPTQLAWDGGRRMAIDAQGDSSTPTPAGSSASATTT